RYRFYPKLFWATARAHCRVRSVRPDLSAAESLHGLSIPRRTVRSKDAVTRRIFVSHPTRHRSRHHDLCAGYRSLRVARLAVESDYLARGRSRHCLHGDRRDEDCKHHATLPNDRDPDWDGDRICGRGLPLVARSLFSKHAIGRGQNGKTAGRQFLSRPAQAIYVLVGPDRRFFSRIIVFRRGPIAGTTVSRWKLAQRESYRGALQCLCEG